jgi:hypothetical protein
VLHEIYSALLCLSREIVTHSQPDSNFDECLSRRLGFLSYILGKSLSDKSLDPETALHFNSGSLNPTPTYMLPQLPFSLL